MKIKLGDREHEARPLTLLDLRANWKALTDVNGEPLTVSATVLALSCGVSVEDVLAAFPLRGGIAALERTAREIMAQNGLEEPEAKPSGEAGNP